MQKPFVSLFMLWVLVCAHGQLALGQSYLAYDPNGQDKTPFEIEEADSDLTPDLNPPPITQPHARRMPVRTPVATGAPGLLDELSFLFAIDGSKQPQDFGVNANLGGHASVNWGVPVIKEFGIGMQLGTGVTSSANAVRVYELLGESTGRTQSFTTVGMFQRTDSGLAWGFAHDFLYQKSFDTFELGQWRIRGSYILSTNNEIGVTSSLNSYSDNGIFGTSTPVTLSPMEQGSLYYRRFWGTGAQTTAWIGIADKHGENNAVTGPSPAKHVPFLFGADLLMPLSASLAIYGETNMITPSDTGTVDAFLGIQWFPGRRAFRARRGSFSPLIPLAAPTSFAVDLSQ